MDIFDIHPAVDDPEYIDQLVSEEELKAAYDEGFNAGKTETNTKCIKEIHDLVAVQNYCKGIDDLLDLIDRHLFNYDKSVYEDLNETFRESAELLKRIRSRTNDKC